MKPIVAVLLAAAVLGTLWFWYVPAQNQDEEPVVCTADAMQCPDGTWVGRSGPNCEFVCAEPGATREVSLYYYNPAQDQGEGGAQCSAAGLVAVTRPFPASITVAEVVLQLLKGELTEEEIAQGVETEFPLEGVMLLSTEQLGSTVTLTFADPQNQTSGGACRAGVLRLQIEQTVKAFTGATEVHFLPEDIFQP